MLIYAGINAPFPESTHTFFSNERVQLLVIFAVCADMMPSGRVLEEIESSKVKEAFIQAVLYAHKKGAHLM